MTNIITDINYDSSQADFLNEKFGCGKLEAKTMLKKHGFIPVLYALGLDAMCFEDKNAFSEDKNKEAMAKFKMVRLINDELFEHKIGTEFVNLDMTPFPGHGCVVEIQSGKVYNGFHLERFEEMEPIDGQNIINNSGRVESKKVKIS